MTVNVRKATVVVSESIASEWLKALAGEDVNVQSSRIIVYEDGAPVDEILRLMDDKETA